MSLLEIQNLSLGFKGVKALNDIHIKLAPARLPRLLVPTGRVRHHSLTASRVSTIHKKGSITFDEGPLLGQSPHLSPSLASHVHFKTLRFEYLTVLENIQLGRHSHYRSRWWQDLFFSQKATEENFGVATHRGHHRLPQS